MRQTRYGVKGGDGFRNCPRRPREGVSTGWSAGTRRAAFTLIELMVVVALIGILIGGVFRLMGAAGKNNERARTIERLQRLENALSGFYSEYGTYPPVPRHGSPDPFIKQDDSGATTEETELKADNAKRAARCQPFGFEFPTVNKEGMNKYIEHEFGNGVYSANVNQSAFKRTETDWSETKLFKYGVMSFLLPRLDAIGKFGNDGLPTEDFPDEIFFDYNQWTQFNEAKKNKYKDQRSRERVACSRWMPNLERIVHGGREFMGVQTGQYEAEYPRFSTVYDQGTGNKHVLQRMTVLDDWGEELYYYSAPPYQSYRIWSAGANKITFPPDYPLSTLTDKQKQQVSAWIADDIARFDR